jgi:hypothetical protein
VAMGNSGNRFDQRLFELKLLSLSRKMQAESLASDRAANRTSQETGGSLLVKTVDGQLMVLRKWLEGIDQIWREVWQTQGETITPNFVRGTLMPKASELIAVRVETIKSNLELKVRRGAVQPGNQDVYRANHHLAMEIRKLQGEVANRYEIEARELAHNKAHKPKVKVPAPIRPVNTVRIVTQAPAPPTEIGGAGYFSPAPKPTRMPSRPDDFPIDLWPKAVGILSKAIQKFPNQKQLPELCEHVTAEMTPLYCEAVESGNMKAGSVLTQRSGMEEMLRLLLVANDPGHSSWGISNQAWEILQTVKTTTWGKLAEAISGVQQGTANLSSI